MFHGKWNQFWQEFPISSRNIQQYLRECLVNETGGLRGHFPRCLLLHHDGVQRGLLQDDIEGLIGEGELAHVHLVPGHTRAVAVPGAHCTDAHWGVVYVGDGVVAGTVHVATHTAVSTTWRKKREVKEGTWDMLEEERRRWKEEEEQRGGDWNQYVWWLKPPICFSGWVNNGVINIATTASSCHDNKEWDHLSGDWWHRDGRAHTSLYLIKLLFNHEQRAKMATSHSRWPYGAHIKCAQGGAAQSDMTPECTKSVTSNKVFRLEACHRVIDGWKPRRETKRGQKKSWESLSCSKMRWK